MEAAAKEFPTLLPAPEGAKEENGKADGSAAPASVLLVGDEQGSVHLYLGGSVFLGTVVLEQGSKVVGVTVLPSSSSTTRVAVLLSSPSPSPTQLATKTFSLSLPPSLEIFTQQSSMLRTHIQHAFEALQEARTLWDESRRIGKAWLARLAELSKSHGGALATFPLLPLQADSFLTRHEQLLNLPSHNSSSFS